MKDHDKIGNTRKNAGGEKMKGGQKCDTATSKETTYRRVMLRRLVAEARNELPTLFLGSVAMLGSSLSNQAFPRLMGRIIDQSTQSSSSASVTDLNRSSSLSSALALVVLGGGLASFLRTTFLGIAEERIASRLRRQAFRSFMLSKDLEWFQSESATQDDITPDKADPSGQSDCGITTAALGEIVRDDVSRVATALTSTVANVLRSSSAVLFSTYHMLTLNPSLFFVAATIVPAVGAVAMFMSKSIRRTAHKQRELADKMAAFLQERLTHIQLVKLSNREEDEVMTYGNLQEESLRLGRLASMQNGFLMGFIFCASSSALLVVVNYGGRSVALGRMTSGHLTSFATYSFLLGLGTSGVIKALGEFLQAMVSAERFYAIVDDSAMPTNDGSGVNIDVQSIACVEFKNVSFQYKTSVRPVLKNVSFKLERGKVVALVGENGSGKSTTASLLAGLYVPHSGRIELSNGTEMSLLSKASKKKLVQLIPQFPALFNTSIIENVRYSNPEASEDEVERALSMSNCDRFVSRLNEGISYNVGMNGSKLSGGERQRLGLARALLSDPVVLVMDETTSSMDVDGATAVSDAILACRQNERTGGRGRALMLITHHARSLELADLVLVMHEGSIVETGTFDYLKGDPKSELRRLIPDLQ